MALKYGITACKSLQRLGSQAKLSLNVRNYIETVTLDRAPIPK